MPKRPGLPWTLRVYHDTQDLILGVGPPAHDARFEFPAPDHPRARHDMLELTVIALEELKD